MYEKKCSEQGFTLIEAIVATGIIGIGFVGVFSMTSASEEIIRKSLTKQILQMQAEQIFENIENDISNIDNYNFDLINCDDLDSTDTEITTVNLNKWCQRINGTVISPTTNDKRIITVTDFSEGGKIVDILFEAYNGQVQIAMKRVYDHAS